MISVIVPVFNTNIQYLRDCIQSILRQSYNDFEVLIIDDGSNNECAEELDRIKATDNRIRLWHITNGGVSKARNFAIDNAKGEYICFVDSDDLLEENCFAEAINLLQGDIDLILGKTNWINSDGVKMRSNFSSSREKSYFTQYDIRTKQNRNVILIRLLSWAKNDTEFKDGFKPEIWCKLYKKSIIGDLRFDNNVKIGEDQIFNFEYLMHSKRIGVVNSVWYNYRVYDDSSFRKIDTMKVEKYLAFFASLKKAFSNNDFAEFLPNKTYYMVKEFANISLQKGKIDTKQVDAAILSLTKLYGDQEVKATLKRLKFESNRISKLDILFYKNGVCPVLLKMRMSKFLGINIFNF